MPRDDDNNQKGVRCSFCNKTQDQVDTLVAGPGVFICNECVELCREVIEDEDATVGETMRISRFPRRRS